MKIDSELKLRPHHVLSYIAHVITEEEGGGMFTLPDKDYIEYWRKETGNFYSDELLLKFRDILKNIYHNQDLKFVYTQGMDTACSGCENENKCSDPMHEYYSKVSRMDAVSVRILPELEFNKIYGDSDLRRFVPTVRKVSELLSEMLKK